MNIKGILEALGYSNITEYPKEFRTSPIYRESKNNSVLVIRKDSGRWIDYAMDIGGNLADLVKISLHLKNNEEANQWLEGKNIYIKTGPSQVEPKIIIPEIFDKECLSRLGKDNSYWINRGIREVTLQKFKGGLAYKGKMAGRYIFPIYNQREDLVGFAGRDIFNNDERIKWKLLGSKDKWIYPAFLNSPLLAKERSIILVESIGDCLALFDAGIENVLVTFGISLTSGILNFLLRIDAHVIHIALNNDQAKGEHWGNDAAEKMKKKLGCYFDNHQLQIILPDKKDFGEMTKEEILLWKKKLYQPLVSSA